MELFETINAMFANPAAFEKTSLHERGRHFFMVNRLFSIKFPVQAQFLNHTKIHPGNAVTYWSETVGKMFSKTPGWMYVKTKKAREEKAKAQPINEATIKYYCQKNQCSRRDVEDAMRLVGQPFLDELISLQKLLDKS